MISRNGHQKTVSRVEAPPARSKTELHRGDQKPPCLPVLADAIPAALRELPQWVAWCYVRRGKPGVRRWTKNPIDPRTGRSASSTDPDTWGPFQEVLGYHIANPDTTDGIGFVFTAGDPFAGVDLDDALDPDGTLKEWARPLVYGLASYIEVSPSGTGVKAFLRAHWPGSASESGRHRRPYAGGEVEGYDRERFFAVTGHRLQDTPAEITEAQVGVQRLYDTVFALGRTATRPAAPADGYLPDAELLDRAAGSAQGAKFRRLWAGDSSGYRSPSEADAALLRLLAFWTGPDPDRLDSLFRRSGLYREDKWGNRPDYRQRTLAFVLGGMTEFYCPPGNGRSRRGPAAATEPAPPDAADDRSATDPAPTAYDIILADYRERYQPTFRRGLAVYSAALRRPVPKEEAIFGAPKDLIDKLTLATDAPRHTDGAVRRDGLPGSFRKWAPSAWTDLLAGLPDEHQAVEIAEDAADDFRGRVAAGLLTLVNHGRRVEGGRGREDTEVEKRSLLDWCRLFAKPGSWQRIRSNQCWACRHPAPPGAPPTAGRLRVAVRCELFGQLHRGDELARMGGARFTRLCHLYGVGEPLKAGGARAVELSAEFLADLAAGPDGLAEGDPRARAHAGAGAQTPGGGESARQSTT